MKNRHKPLRTTVSAAVIALISSTFAQAGSFSLYTESSPIALGNYAAGIAAEAADASTGWYNPAGLALIHDQQLAMGGSGVFPVSKLTGSSTYRASFLGTQFPDYVETFNGLDGADSGFVPSLHYALPLGENATFALSVVSPFGLATDWAVNSPVRYQATFTEVLTATVSPEIGAKVNENFAVGAGLDLQYARVKYNLMLGLPNIDNFFFNNPALYDTLSYNKASSYGVGFHAGVMGMFNDNHTRLGLNYQSKVKHTFHGFSRLSGALPGGTVIGDPIPVYGEYENNTLSSDPIQFPDILTMSAYHDLNDTFAVLGSVVYSGWHVFKEIRLNNVSAPNVTPTGSIPALVNVDAPQVYSGAWRLAVGLNYHVNDLWMLRFGGGYDQTPTNDLYRDVRLADVDRWALSVGTHYQVRPNVGVDFGYTHLFAVNKPKINATDIISPTSSYNVTTTGGTVYANLVGAQVNWMIDQADSAATK